MIRSRKFSFALFAFFSGFCGLAVVAKEPKVRPVYEIMLDRPISEEGGVVIIQPIETRFEGKDRDRLNKDTYQLRVSSQITIVRLPYPKGGSYTYRFRPADSAPNSDKQIHTDRISVGSAWDYDPDEPARSESIETVLTHHFETIGGNWTIDKSREVSANLPMGFLEKRYRCESQGLALVCDATDGDMRR